MEIQKLEERIKDLKRIKIIAKENVVFKPHKISRLDKKILLNFEKIRIKELAKKLRCNRSYIYAIIGKYKSMYTKSEVSGNSSHT